MRMCVNVYFDFSLSNALAFNFMFSNSCAQMTVGQMQMSKLVYKFNYSIFNSIFLNFLFIAIANGQNEMNEKINPDIKQIGTNNCTARYRTLSGGIGESPSLSPSPSSDYDDDETVTKQHLPNLSKTKRNGNHKGAIISQKVTVHQHHVSTWYYCMPTMCSFSYSFYFPALAAICSIELAQN